jgi:prepilin-type N-terminal cleavage/methylation domain-containing protein
LAAIRQEAFKAFNMKDATNKMIQSSSLVVGRRGGFTLVELLIAIGLFSLVTITLTNAFLAAFRTQRSAFAFLQMQNNIRHALEVMSREMRTGTQFSLPAPNRIRFVNDKGIMVEYCNAGGAIRKAIGTTCGVNSFALTSENVTVENAVFELNGAAAGDGRQPRITILLRIASSGIASDLQVTITQRELDS